MSRTILTQTHYSVFLNCYWNVDPMGSCLPICILLKKTDFDSFFPCFPNTIMPITSFNYISSQSVLCEHDYCDSALKAFKERAGDDSQSLWFIVLFFHLHSDDHCVQGDVMKVNRVLSGYGHFWLMSCSELKCMC